MNHMLQVREEREAGHMAKRRSKLAAQADNNMEMQAYWLDAKQSTDEEVRREVTEVHKSYARTMEQIYK